MGIQIERIQFENYRQYGTTEINFVKDEKADSQLFAFVAQNGTGKTTLLKAITWCLYGKEASGLSSSRGDSKSLPLVNTTTLDNTAADQEVPVSVSFRFMDEEKNSIEFTRKTSYKQKDKKKPMQGSVTFFATKTPPNGGNTETYMNDQAELFLRNYFDAAISNFYFFDGEKLPEFFNTDLKDSIYNIAQVHLLENTIAHVETVKKGLNDKIGKEMPGLQSLQADIESEEKYMAGLKEKLSRISAQLPQAQDTYEACDDALHGYRPVQELQKQRDALLQEQNEIEQRLMALKNEKIEFIQKYLPVLALYSRIKKVADYISTKADAGKLPPSIDRAQIETLLGNLKRHLDQDCPMCGHHLDQADLTYLETVLKQYDISSATSNFLSLILSPLENAVNAAHQYPKKREALQEESKRLSKKERDIERELDKVNRQFAAQGGEAGQEKAALLNEEYNKARQVLIDLQADEKHFRAEIQKSQTKLDDFNRQMEAYQEKQQVEQDDRKRLQVLKKLGENFEKVRDQIVDETKAEMQKLTWETFSSMIWKKNTFGKIDIDDTYSVTLYDIYGHAMNANASATEIMALAYAFTLSVHQVSGQNSPLVIDSPLGRVSDDNREKMAEALLKAAKDKQIIMLFTPDEYSEPVRKLYENHATVRMLQLSAKENVLEGVKPYGR